MGSGRQAQRIGNVKEGIKVVNIVKDSETTAFTTQEYLRYNKDNLEFYKGKFRELIQAGILNDGKFEDVKWTGKNDGECEISIDFKSYEYNKQLYNALKAYAIVELYNRRISLRTVASRVFCVIKILQVTKGYDEDYMDDYIDYMDEGKRRSNTDYKFGNMSFIFFNPIGDWKEYFDDLETLESIHLVGENVREIPDYKSIILFDYIINDVMTKEMQNREKYYPLYLWWSITTIIPLRPAEFVKMKKDCCYFDEKIKEYYIKVPREKQSPNPLSKRRVIPIVDTLKITKKMYDLIEDYKNICKINRSQSEYLLNLEVYARFTSYEQYSYTRSKNKDRMGYEKLKKLLDTFYDEIVSKEYKYKIVDTGKSDNDDTIVKLKLGDSRHLAFLSMLLQGFNPITIAEIGGHESLSSQLHYVAHIDEFSDAHTLMLIKKIRTTLNQGMENLDVLTTREKKLIGYRDKPKIVPRSIDEGLCYSENFPNECIDKDCIFCNHFEFNFDNVSYKKYKELNDNTHEIRDEITSKISFIKRYYDELIKQEVFIEDVSPIPELAKETKKLDILLNREALLKAYIDKLKEIEV